MCPHSPSDTQLCVQSGRLYPTGKTAATLGHAHCFLTINWYFTNRYRRVRCVVCLSAQLRRYLSDSRCGCDEGLLITFDKALPNGLSATRVTRVTDIHAWAQLYNDSPRNAPAFATQPMHGLESDPLAVGVMMGLCQAYGVVVVPANITR